MTAAAAAGGLMVRGGGQGRALAEGVDLADAQKADGHPNRSDAHISRTRQPHSHHSHHTPHPSPLDAPDWMALAMPKSMSLSWPSTTKKLAGLRSLCTMRSR